MNKQLILKDESAVMNLLSLIAKPESIQNYFDGEVEIDRQLLSRSKIEVGKPPELEPNSSSDAKSAIKVYEFLGPIDRTLATDPRLWTYLTHITFKDYTRKRWNIKVPATNDEKEINKSKDLIVERWFFYRSKAIAHNSVGRLWWAAFLTHEPWNRCDLNGLVHDDPYVYTKVLFSNQNVQVSLIEREIFSSPILLNAVLEFIRQNPDYASVKIQALSKELNLVAGVKKLSSLSFAEAFELVTKTASEIRER